jgi:hypothetical protein
MANIRVSFDIGDEVYKVDDVRSEILGKISGLEVYKIAAILICDENGISYKLRRGNGTWSMYPYLSDDLVSAERLEGCRKHLLAEMGSRVGLVGTFHALRGSR